jgi:hypothetical protein
MYAYANLRPELFTEEGQRLLIGIRDNAKRLIKCAGAATMGCLTKLPNGIGAADSWAMMACVDRLVELGDIREIPTNGRAQDRVFVARNWGTE